MKLRIRSRFIAVALIVTAAGCHEPREIVPVAPPGFEINRTPTLKEGEGAQAIGETQITEKNMALKTKVKSTAPTSPPTAVGQSAKSPTGLVYETLKEGTGASALPGQNVKIRYTGTLTDGTVFDSSTIDIPISTGKVIEGWDEGIPGMKIGERRKLTIPGELGYKAAGYPPKIPPNATLIFEVELLEAK